MEAILLVVSFVINGAIQEVPVGIMMNQDLCQSVGQMISKSFAAQGVLSTFTCAPLGTPV